MVPPEALPPVDVTPSPVTVNPPLLPVLFSTIPLAAPLAEILLKIRLPAPIVTPFTLMAVPVPLVMVLPVPCTVTVPPPVALKPTPDEVVRERLLPLKLMVAPVLDVRLIALPVEVLSVFVPVPLMLMVPPVSLLIEIPVMALFVLLNVPLYVTLAAPAFTLMVSLVGLAIDVVLLNVNVPADPLKI